jgi:hypothetical protein
MTDLLSNSKFELIDSSGVIYNPLLETMHLSKYKFVNYILCAKKIDNI